MLGFMRVQAEVRKYKARALRRSVFFILGTWFKEGFVSLARNIDNIIERDFDNTIITPIFRIYNKKAVLPQGNRAMPQVFFFVEVRQQHSLQV